MTPEARARQTIDALLTVAGWHVCDVANANLRAGDGVVKGVAIREFPLNPGQGVADYLLYVNGKACGVIEAKKEGAMLSSVEAEEGASGPVPLHAGLQLQLTRLGRRTNGRIEWKDAQGRTLKALQEAKASTPG